MPPSTSLVSHGQVQQEPAAIYGQGDVFLRLGNGGAGATGLIKALAEDFLRSRQSDDNQNYDGAIAWVANHSRNTQLALLYDFIDIGFTYERDQEAIAESEGWMVNKGCAFHDHFCLVGPSDDPAGISSLDSVTDALARIATTGCLFHSRADFSATMAKERSLWSSIDRKPWNDQTESKWYRTTLLSPDQALRKADKAGAYCLTDRSTFLWQRGISSISNTRVFFEPTQDTHVLMNSCYAICSSAAPSTAAANETARFLAYLQSPRGQGVVKRYGVAEYGLPLFAPVADKLADPCLRELHKLRSRL